MIQQLILEQFGVVYSVHYISQLLKNMGFSYQKAKFVSDHLNEEKRDQWLAKTWPEILTHECRVWPILSRINTQDTHLDSA